MSLILTVSEGSGPDSVELTQGRNLKIGRSAGSDLRVLHLSVSSNHAIISGGELEDVGSTNGTVVNKQKLPQGTRHLLHEGDEILFGEVVVKVALALPTKIMDIAPPMKNLGTNGKNKQPPMSTPTASLEANKENRQGPNIARKAITKSKFTLGALKKPPLRERSVNTEVAKYTKKTAVKDVYALSRQVIQDTKLLNRVLGFLGESELSRELSWVCTKWRSSCLTVLSAKSIESVASLCEDFDSMSMTKKSSLLQSCTQGLRRNFPRGSFLSAGSYKDVYRVWCQEKQRYEAISVMSLGLINESASLSVVATEVKVSILVSDLVRNNVCLNFIETYEVFASKDSPPEDIWGESEPCREKLENDVFQYIRMELCDLGDLEEFVKTFPKELPSMNAVRGIFFQMCFSLFKGQQSLQLRHYDVKLLNFFCKSNQQGFSANLEQTYQDRESSVLVKLADFGTAEVECEPRSVAVDHLCTLENTPPEFLLQGDQARADCVDAFALGLCFLHLLTGSRPYEEILGKVKCPSALKMLLFGIWSKDDSFSVLQKVVKNDADDVLYDTLYRFFVMFSLPFGEASWGSNYGKVAQAIDNAMDSPTRKWDALRKQLAKDQKEFNLELGSNTYIKRAFGRAQSTVGAVTLLRGLVHFDPTKRTVDLGPVIKSDFFRDLTL